MLTDAYENKLKSMQAELDETYQMVKESGQNLNVLNTQRKQLEDDLERTVSMNEQLTISKEKYLKMSMRLQDEKDGNYNYQLSKQLDYLHIFDLYQCITSEE